MALGAIKYVLFFFFFKSITTALELSDGISVLLQDDKGKKANELKEVHHSQQIGRYEAFEILWVLRQIFVLRLDDINNAINVRLNNFIAG